MITDSKPDKWPLHSSSCVLTLLLLHNDLDLKISYGAFMLVTFYWFTAVSGTSEQRIIRAIALMSASSSVNVTCVLCSKGWNQCYSHKVRLDSLLQRNACMWVLSQNSTHVPLQSSENDATRRNNSESTLRRGVGGLCGARSFARACVVRSAAPFPHAPHETI